MQRDFIALYPGRINTRELCPGRANNAVHMQAASCTRTCFFVVVGDAVVHGDCFVVVFFCVLVVFVSAAISQMMTWPKKNLTLE